MLFRSFDREITSAIAEARENSEALAVLAWDGVAIAVFATADSVKADAAETISALTQRGIESWLMTGDTAESAAKVAAAVGMSADKVIAGAHPQDKLQKIKELQENGKKVAMVGDGVNDAAALAQSDLSIAMGTGTDTAISTADITIMRPALFGIIGALELAEKTLSTIKANLTWAFIYNVVGIPVAALGLMNPIYAAAAMAVSSLFVVTNSLRIQIGRAHV